MEAFVNKLLLAGAVALVVALPISASSAFAKTASPVAALDTNNDSTVDLNEVNKAAEELFTKLDKDNDGTVDAKELQGRLSKTEFKTADPDNDGTLTKDEFLSAVSTRFKSADPDNDGTLDKKELASKPGKALLRVTH
jgi:hypothetical protein